MMSNKMDKLKEITKKIPLINKVAKIIYNTIIMKFEFHGSKEFWEKRYKKMGTSGPGSYGKFAEFKAEIINTFVKNNDINSVTEFGCGDGNQLSLLKVPKYIGLDVSKSVIKMEFINLLA